MKKLVFLLLVPWMVCAHNVSRNIKITKVDEMNFPPFPLSIKKIFQEEIENEKKKGYVEKDNEYARKLLRLKYTPPKFIESNKEESDLRKNSAEIKINFTYKSFLPNAIAYAPLGFYTDTGWSGIKEFFNGKEIGICALSVFNIPKINGAIQLNIEGLRYDVNDKPTRTSIEGSINSGFVYSVRWYDDYFRQIECANSNYDKDILDKIIELAKIVDKN